MSLPDDHLRYPLRRHGMDHDRYAWSMLAERPPVAWPGGARIALWIAPALQWFPLDMKGQPFKPPGALVTAYPDLRHYTLRDYGNRVGIHRIMKALDRHGWRASAAVNAAVAARTPSLVDACVDRGWEIVGHGLDMDHLHHGGLPEDEERGWIERSLEILREASGQPVRGWHSPANSESRATPELLAACGVDWLCDWVNDDMPYAMRAGSRTLVAMPHSNDLDDHTVLVANHHDEDEYRDQLVDQFDLLYDEAGRAGGRILSLPLHPWITGQPYRIGVLEEVFQHIAGHDGVWCATGSEIVDAWRAARNLHEPPQETA